MRDLIKDMTSFILGASMLGFPIGYLVGSCLSGKYKK